MRTNRLSGRERGEQNLAKVRVYLAGLKADNEPLPLDDGRPNIKAISDASGVLRSVFYTNAGVKRLLALFTGSGGEPTEPPRPGASRGTTNRNQGPAHPTTRAATGWHKSGIRGTA